MDLVFVTGITGTEKRAVLRTLSQHAMDVGYRGDGSLEVYHVEDEFRNLGITQDAFLQLLNPRDQREQWQAAVSRILKSIQQRFSEGKPPRRAVVTLHYNFFLRTRFITPVVWEPLRELARLAERVVFITLIEDSYVVWARVNRRRRSPGLRLSECVFWRDVEINSTELCARELLADSTSRTHPEHFTVAVNHSPSTLLRLMFEPDVRRAYLCFPISVPRLYPDKFPPAEVNAFRYKIQDDFGYAALDPLGIDEELLAIKLQAAVRGVLLQSEEQLPERAELPELLKLLKESGGDLPATLVIEAEDRWFIPQERRLLQDDTLSRMGREPVKYPIEIPMEQVLEVVMPAHWRVAPRDLKWIDEADCIAAYRPFWGGSSLHGGVFSELWYAIGAGKKQVFAYDPPEDSGTGGSPFVGHVPTIETPGDFYSDLEAFVPPRPDRH